MSKNRPKNITGLKICAYVFGVMFSVMIFFPIVYMFSSAVKDDLSVYDMPPRLIPEPSKSITIAADYSGHDESGLKETILTDAALALFSPIYEFNKSSIGEIIFHGTRDGETVFYTRAHRMLLILELNYGNYNNVNINKNTVSYNNKAIDTMEKIGYEFDLGGLDKSYVMTENEFSSGLEELFNGKSELSGSYTDRKSVV